MRVWCGTTRRIKGVEIWKLPNVKDEDHKKMEGRLARGNKLIATLRDK